MSDLLNISNIMYFIVQINQMNIYLMLYMTSAICH